MTHHFSKNSISTEALPMPSLLLIPTGIGCSIGGYAGDAIPFARLLASASGCLITHPNVMNGANLYWNDKRIQYVEGFGIDRFASGDIYLKPVRQQKVGLLFDRAIEQELLGRHLQVLDACRTSLGIDIGPVVITDNPLDVSLKMGTSGSSWGTVAHPDSLLRAGEKLKDQGATAIAVVTRFPDHLESHDIDAYRKGEGVDVMAGAEAVISHLLVRHLTIPCAHAPALPSVPFTDSLDPRVAGEELGHTFLPCVLVGLSRAPDLVPKEVAMKSDRFTSSELLSVDQLGAVVATEGALGGEATLACIEKNVPLIVVSNKGVLNVDSEALGLFDSSETNRQASFVKAKTYLEAAGLLLSLREGIAIESLKRPVKPISDKILSSK